MELPDGVYVTSTSTDAWEPDPGVPGTEFHVLCEADGVAAGMTRMLEPGAPLHWTPEKRETICILEGRVRIEFEGGGELDLGPGDIASLQPGIPTVWHLTTPFKEVWVIA